MREGIKVIAIYAVILLVMYGVGEIIIDTAKAISSILH